jgi:hypothetical protein
VDSIKKDKAKGLGALACKMEQLWVALIALANSTQDSRNANVACIPIPVTFEIVKLKGLDSVAVPTVNVPVSQTAEYKDTTIGTKRNIKIGNQLISSLKPILPILQELRVSTRRIVW